MQLHLVDRGRLRQLGEAAHGRRFGRPGGAQREHPRVLDQDEVVLAHPEAEALDVERPLGDPAHERMRVLGFPHVGRRRAQLVA